MSDFLWAKVWWGVALCVAAFIAGLMGWLPGQRRRKDDEEPK